MTVYSDDDVPGVEAERVLGEIQHKLDQHAHGQCHTLGDPGEKGKRRQRLDVASVGYFGIFRREREMIGDPEIVDPTSSPARAASAISDGSTMDPCCTDTDEASCPPPIARRRRHRS